MVECARCRGMIENSAGLEGKAYIVIVGRTTDPYPFILHYCESCGTEVMRVLTGADVLLKWRDEFDTRRSDGCAGPEEAGRKRTGNKQEKKKE